MSSDAVRQQLEQAYAYIKDKKYFEARAILLPIVQQDRENADAWWLLANAQTDPGASRDALQIVLKLKPDNANARAMLDRIDKQYPPAPSVDEPFTDLPDPFSAPPVKPSSSPASLDDLLTDMGRPPNAPSSTSGGRPYLAPPIAPPMPRYTERQARPNRLLYILLGVGGTLACLCLACVGLGFYGVSQVTNNPTFQAVLNVFTLPDHLPESAKDQGAITASKPVDGVVNVGQFNTYSYKAQSGEKVTIEVAPLNSRSSTTGALVGLYDPSGNRVAGTGLFDTIGTAQAGNSRSLDVPRKIDYTFSQAGTYTILVSGLSTNISYELTLTSSTAR